MSTKLAADVKFNTVQWSFYYNRQKPSFNRLRKWLTGEKLTSYSCGGLVMLASMIPIVNIFAMPVAVAGATVNWVEHGK